MERALILWPARVIEPQALPERMQTQRGGEPRLGGDFTVEDIERQHVFAVLSRTATLDDAARILGIDASTLWRKRKKYQGE
jgi:NtrC-family two-component system response regulator AlgB